MIDESAGNGLELRYSLDKLCDKPADASYDVIKAIAEQIAASVIPVQTFDVITTHFKNAVVREVKDSEIWKANREQVEACLTGALRQRFVELSSQELVKHGFVGGILKSFGQLVERQMREPGVEIQELIDEILNTKAEDEGESMFKTVETSLKKGYSDKASSAMGTTAALDPEATTMQYGTGKAKDESQLTGDEAKAPKQEDDNKGHETERARKKRKRSSSKAPSSNIIPSLDSPPPKGHSQMDPAQATVGDGQALLISRKLGQADKHTEGGWKRNRGRPSWGAEKSEKRKKKSHHKYNRKGEKLY